MIARVIEKLQLSNVYPANIRFDPVSGANPCRSLVNRSFEVRTWQSEAASVSWRDAVSRFTSAGYKHGNIPAFYAWLVEVAPEKGVFVCPPMGFDHPIEDGTHAMYPWLTMSTRSLNMFDMNENKVEFMKGTVFVGFREVK